MNFGTAPLDVSATISLVPRCASDAAEMFALLEAERPALREWLGWIDATRTVADARRYAQYAEAQFESRMGFDFAIREAGAIVGAIGLHELDWGNRSAQLGYWLAPFARNRGIMTAAVRTLTTHALRRFALERLEIRCAVENARSRAVAERLGFTHEGTLSRAHALHGRFWDLALYATTAPSWPEP